MVWLMSELDSGLLIIDKPCGPTSHDVVGRIRKTLQTKAVGHAGTLDPMASGVLIVMVGQCTKLSQFLTLEQKQYEARVRFGVATDTLDAWGTETERRDIDPWLSEELKRIEAGAEPGQGLVQALEAERHRILQVPPAHSAIKQNGQASYARARRGEVVELPPREVRVLDLQVLGAASQQTEIALRLRVSKGYYVRSFARDLGIQLGTCAHLSGLRRTTSGQFSIDRAISLDSTAAQMRSCMLSLEVSARMILPSSMLKPESVKRAISGQRLLDDAFDVVPQDGPTSWFSPEGKLIAVGLRDGDVHSVMRAFPQDPPLC
jgi:tRNA pseudouridine55 synthase